jgi:hypothetical protein
MQEGHRDAGNPSLKLKLEVTGPESRKGTAAATLPCQNLGCQYCGKLYSVSMCVSVCLFQPPATS